MRIEKLNDNQIKFILSKDDLLERDIRLSELAYGSEKAQELFREMMLQAMIKHDFHTNNDPLMVEAIPVSSDSITIIVTKVAASQDVEDKFGFFTKQRESKEAKRNIREKETLLNQLGPEYVATDATIEKILGQYTSGSNVPFGSILVYSFDSLDDMANLSTRLMNSVFNGTSSSYKYNNRFFLVLEDIDLIFEETLYLESVLDEYGHKHVSTSMSKYFLIEHGEIFINNEAVEKLSQYLGS